MSKKKTLNEFIEKAKQVHGDKYDYSKVKYIDNKTKICIICPEHGEFWQMPSCHLSGKGCKLCGYEKSKKSQRFTTEIFVEKAIDRYGKKYDYSKVNYINSQTPVLITCNIHGDFSMRPNDHLQGQECPKCKLLKLRKKFALTTKQFIEKAKQVHGDRYDYSKVEYVNNKTKVCIICPEHGEFWQSPDKHLTGDNCPQCNRSKLEEKTSNILTKNEIIFEEQKHFNWLGKQSLDFYLPDYNIAIECQGIEHFKPVSKFNGIDGFIETNSRDKKKYKLCSENGIKIIYYSELKEYYTFLDEILVKNEYDLLKIIKTEKEK